MPIGGALGGNIVKFALKSLLLLQFSSDIDETWQICSLWYYAKTNGKIFSFYFLVLSIGGALGGDIVKFALKSHLLIQFLSDVGETWQICSLWYCAKTNREIFSFYFLVLSIGGAFGGDIVKFALKSHLLIQFLLDVDETWQICSLWYCVKTNGEIFSFYFLVLSIGGALGGDIVKFELKLHLLLQFSSDVDEIWQICS